MRSLNGVGAMNISLLPARPTVKKLSDYYGFLPMNPHDKKGHQADPSDEV